MSKTIGDIYKLVLIANCSILFCDKVSEWWWDSGEYIVGISDMAGMCVNYQLIPADKYEL